MSPAPHTSRQALSTNPPAEPERVIFFDGVCGLCNASVDFIIRHDPAKRFRFSPLQSPYAAATLNHLPFTPSSPGAPTSMLLLDAGRVYTHSTAVLKVLKTLGWPWSIVHDLLIPLPAPYRDPVYSFIAKHRYHWFGKKPTCRLPNPDDHDRFLF